MTKTGEINILGHPYELWEGTPAEIYEQTGEAAVDGVLHRKTHRIFIDAALPVARYNECVLHEILHEVLLAVESRIAHDEAEVGRISRALHAVGFRIDRIRPVIVSQEVEP